MDTIVLILLLTPLYLSTGITTICIYMMYKKIHMNGIATDLESILNSPILSRIIELAFMTFGDIRIKSCDRVPVEAQFSHH